MLLMILANKIIILKCELVYFPHKFDRSSTINTSSRKHFYHCLVFVCLFVLSFLTELIWYKMSNNSHWWFSLVTQTEILVDSKIVMVWSL